MKNMIRKTKRKLGDWRYNFYVDNRPRTIIDRIWMRDFGYTVEWKHPRDLNEKIEWLICYGDTSAWPDLADKYKVREYVKEKGYEYLLPQLYGVWKDVSQIDYTSLPNKFVIKCNHDCGSYHIVNKQDGFNMEDINLVMNTVNLIIIRLNL